MCIRDRGVLPRGDRDARLPVELLHALEHHGARRHVDAQRQRLRGEDDLEQAQPEEFLDDLLEGRQQPRMMRGDATFEVVQPVPVAEHGQILIAQRRCV